jgi:hypothetical protein
MPVPDFSPGEVLTAAAMDSIGLWKVAEGTLSSTATNFAGCFSSTYDNYRIIVDQIVLSTAGEVYWRILSGTTPEAANYRHGMTGINTIAGSLNTTNNGTTSAFTGVNVSAGVDGLMLCNLVMDIFGPNIAQRTFAHCYATAYSSANGFRSGVTVHNSTTSYDGIQFSTQSGTTFTGNVKIYGYRK